MATKFIASIGFVAAFAGFQTQADEFFTAHLTHDQETAQGTFMSSSGGSRPESYGHGVFRLNEDQDELWMKVTVYNIDVTGAQTPNDTFDNLVNAHIHASPTAAVGANAPVVWGFFGTPDNDNNPDDLVVEPFASGVGGTFISKWDLAEGNATTLLLQLPNILTGHSYVNFHTVQFRGGEIRGALVHVPDGGATAAMILGGIAGIAGLRRRSALK